MIEPDINIKGPIPKSNGFNPVVGAGKLFFHFFFRWISTPGHILRLTMFLEFVILPLTCKKFENVDRRSCETVFLKCETAFFKCETAFLKSETAFLTSETAFLKCETVF